MARSLIILALSLAAGCSLLIPGGDPTEPDPDARADADVDVDANTDIDGDAHADADRLGPRS